MSKRFTRSAGKAMVLSSLAALVMSASVCVAQEPKPGGTTEIRTPAVDLLTQLLRCFPDNPGPVGELSLQRGCESVFVGELVPAEYQGRACLRATRPDAPDLELLLFRRNATSFDYRNMNKGVLESAGYMMFDRHALALGLVIEGCEPPAPWWNGVVVQTHVAVDGELQPSEEVQANITWTQVGENVDGPIDDDRTCEPKIGLKLDR